MHEASLVESLLDQVAQCVQRTFALQHAYLFQGEHAAELSQVVRIEVELGPLSGVEPELMRLAFERLAPPFGLSHAALVLDWVPLTTRCVDCGVAAEHTTAVFHCPACGGSRVSVERGDAVILKNIELITD